MFNCKRQCSQRVYLMLSTVQLSIVFTGLIVSRVLHDDDDKK